MSARNLPHIHRPSFVINRSFRCGAADSWAPASTMRRRHRLRSSPAGAAIVDHALPRLIPTEAGCCRPSGPRRRRRPRAQLADLPPESSALTAEGLIGSLTGDSPDRAIASDLPTAQLPARPKQLGPPCHSATICSRAGRSACCDLAVLRCFQAAGRMGEFPRQTPGSRCEGARSPSNRFCPVSRPLAAHVQRAAGAHPRSPLWPAAPAS
jgi:hypothetical protein